MTRPVFLAFVLLLGCGGTSAPGAGSAESTTGAEPLSHQRADLGCTDVLPSGESDCVAGGCEWRAPLWCSGIEVSEVAIERARRDLSRPCRCVCQRDVLDCMARP
jgi:hypothetical protein